jgi:hypothetical protein
MLSLIISLLSLFISLGRGPAARLVAETPLPAGTAADAGQEPIEIGATGPDLRYWLAKEALRQSERSLSIEVAALAALVSQATTMLGWIVTALTASASAILYFGAANTHPEWRVAAIVISIGLLVPAAACIFVIFPRRGIQTDGFDAPQILGSAPGTTTRNTVQSELEQIESLALGLFAAITANRKRILKYGRALGFAWTVFVTAPVTAVIVMEVYLHW